MSARLLWDVYVVRDGSPSAGSIASNGSTPEAVLGVFLVEVPHGEPGRWPRLEALDPSTLRTIALMWAPKTVWHPAGPRIDGLDDLETSARVTWVLTNPRSP